MKLARAFPAAFLFLSVALVACKASLPAETYWNKVLHNTPMPKAVKDSLDVKANVGKGGTTVNAGRPKGKPVVVTVKPKPYGPFYYKYAASDTDLDKDQHTAVFFKEKDLKQGNSMNLHFTTSTSPPPFLPRKVADSIPFSSDKMPEILARLSVTPGSPEATILKTSIKECEDKPIEGEDKHCTTSLEAMVDYATSKLGTHLSAISTEPVEKYDKVDKYTILSATQLGIHEGSKDSPVVVCHRQSYVYAVFYCHETTTTRAYEVSLEGLHGGKVKAVAVCHTDTSKWNPKHLAFVELKVKPGTIPVCHFLPVEHVVWVPK